MDTYYLMLPHIADRLKREVIAASNNAASVLLDLREVVKYEVDCQVFGQGYREFTTDPLDEIIADFGISQYQGDYLRACLYSDVERLIAYTRVTPDKAIEVEWLTHHSCLIHADTPAGWLNKT